MLPIFNISLIGRVDARGLNGPLPYVGLRYVIGVCRSRRNILAHAVKYYRPSFASSLNIIITGVDTVRVRRSEPSQ